ncbi:hypothetical protein [Planctomycetes bacterium TBK1r]|uniref:Uncharacterized protein n=1 Tax=Stieleria magnilauensis TaxID=2527963 RepID=A0ABX5XK60_9BACT|nr:hypothetical protein TBK1r_10770 [Planctomycetes bacterium TBK1r]
MTQSFGQAHIFVECSPLTYHNSTSYYSYSSANYYTSHFDYTADETPSEGDVVIQEGELEEFLNSLEADSSSPQPIYYTSG